MVVWDAPPLPVRAAGRAKPAFVGRAAETAAAEQGWAAVRSGARELIFIGGEPGAGKSRLVEEIAAALHRRGAVVLIGTCSPEPGRPYEPFVECLEQLLGGTAEGALAEYLGGSAGELLLCTHRTTAPDRSDELTYAIADLYRLDGVRRIDLPGFSADEVAQYLVAEGGLPVRRAREHATVLRDQTGGNPFFLRETWRDINRESARRAGWMLEGFGQTLSIRQDTRA